MGGEHTLAKSAGAYSDFVALSGQHVVWTITHAPQAVDGLYDAAEPYYSDVRSTDSAMPTRTKSASPEANSGIGLLRTGEVYAAFPGSIAGGDGGIPARYVYVVQPSTGKTCRLSYRAGTLFNRVLAVTDTELLLAEQDIGVHGAYDAGHIQRLARIDPAQLDVVVAGWSP